MFKKEEKPKIEFVCSIPYLETIEECMPKPAHKFIPTWWKNLLVSKGYDTSTVKDCPSFPDFFSQGFIVPMWMDSILEYNKESDRWDAFAPSEMKPWGIHPHSQFLDYTDAKMYGSKGSIVFKSESPWKIITPPGYSVMQMPLFYHFDDDFSILPGIVDTDIHHEMNQQVLYHGDGKKIFIKRGQPFVLYVPFKRTDYDMIIRTETEKDKARFAARDLSYKTKLVGQKEYRNLQRLRDKDIK
jgi:hypothetical protein